MNLRYKTIFGIFTIVFFLLISRLFYWQVVKAEELSRLGQSQYGKTIVIQPQRGEIRTSDGFPVVANKTSYFFAVNPKEISDKQKVQDLLVNTLKENEASIGAKLVIDKFWVPIKDAVDEETKRKMEASGFPGFYFDQKYTRFYPEASMAAQLTGFVGKDDHGEDKGYFGLEGYYERLLQGKEGKALQMHDAFGKPILAKMSESSAQVDGSNLILTIDRVIQFDVEKKLKENVERFEADSGMIGIMDPKTGKILAMASYPNFSQENYQDYSGDLYKNPFISNLYEPGSTFKPLIMSAALDAKLVKPTTKCPICAGPVSIGEYDIHTWDDKYRKDLTMTEVIQHSDNTGMVYVAQKLGFKRMSDYLKKFGIENLSGIDLQGEVTSSFEDKTWYPVDVATLGFGQGISVTPIQILSAISAIANNGKRMEPHVVDGVESPDKSITKIAPKVIGSPVSDETAKVMTEMMVNAVDKGEASWAKLQGYRVAGKTGTASIPIKGHYDPQNTIASFVGFAPADNPKFVMLVIFVRPKASIYGAETAAPVFFSIAKDLLMYYGISPERQ
jgi:stage V sporulation protein D (sporulation-specific penicillin-binding protein)